MSSKTASFKSLLYGVPVAVIAEWCCVSTAVASKYKEGVRSPSPAAQRLFALHLEGRVVPDEWQGFCFRGGQFWDPYGKAFTHGQLRAYEIGLQLLRAFAYGDPDRLKRVEELFLISEQNKLLAYPQVRGADPKQ